MTLTPEERLSIINYRIEKANATLNEAKTVMKAKLWNLAVNRFYYSVFYAANALLLSEGLTATTHKGVWSMLNLHFVKPGKLSREDASIMGQLFTMRHTGDYDDIFDWDEGDATEFLPKTEYLLQKLISLIPHR